MAVINPNLQTHLLFINVRLLRVLQEVQFVEDNEQVRQDISQALQVYVKLLKKYPMLQLTPQQLERQAGFI